jgi:putative transcriptional regulator
MIWLQRSLLALAALLPLALHLVVAAPTPQAAPETLSLAGQLLVAAPEMGDPRFAHTVVLMVRHDKDGAFGIIINRPISERPLAELLGEMGYKDEGIEGRVRVFFGGPVELGIGFVLHSADYHRPGTLDIDGRVAMTATPEILRDIARKQGPMKSLFAIGYAGWGAGQLEDELARHDWFTAIGDAKLIFDDDREKLWEHAMARRTREL